MRHHIAPQQFNQHRIAYHQNCVRVEIKFVFKEAQLLNSTKFFIFSQPVFIVIGPCIVSPDISVCFISYKVLFDQWYPPLISV